MVTLLRNKGSGFRQGNSVLLKVSKVLDAAGNLSLPAVASCMVSSEEEWNAVASFCEEVMVLKEAAERVRESATSLPTRSRRRGRRRVADLRPP
ncbi:hypothetical protein B5X24_HaOG203494 [Helicoverpa armigera]|uniref:Uncharacterized protein n=1 Tax=Helicoverpa armigera TaxID=29058 RepID=A0A2W1BUJ4_HELAM|nr:hypothetical protein B5X24_HaOG203494 [Helicoverpa armigera]